MKNILVLSVLSLCISAAAICQTRKGNTTVNDYAMLQVVDDENVFTVEYSNGEKKVNLYELLKLDAIDESLPQDKYKCFEYLSKQGYELVTSNSFSYRIDRDVEVKYEYVFRKKTEY